MRVALVVLALAAMSACGGGSDEAAVTTPWPDSMAVLGHSGATGYNSDPANPYTDARQNSWGTGSNSAVDSVYRRILAENPAIEGHNANLAKDGGTIEDLAAQARRAAKLTPKPQLIVIQILDNDIGCDGSDPKRYAAFGKKFAAVLGRLTSRLPGVRIFVVSQYGRPERFFAVINDTGDPAAIGEFSGTGPCDAFDYGKLVPERIAYLTKVIEGYEDQEATACKRFTGCYFSRSALSSAIDKPERIASDLDHLSIAGHKEAAAVAWPELLAAFNYG
jgi:lysophospholipase L1-like esterase